MCTSRRFLVRCATIPDILPRADSVRSQLRIKAIMGLYPHRGCRSGTPVIRRRRLRRLRVRHCGEEFLPLTGFARIGSSAGGQAPGQAAAAKPAGALSDEIWPGRIPALGYSKVRIKLRCGVISSSHSRQLRRSWAAYSVGLHLHLSVAKSAGSPAKN